MNAVAELLILKGLEWVAAHELSLTQVQDVSVNCVVVIFLDNVNRELPLLYIDFFHCFF